MRISDWSSDVCSSDLLDAPANVGIDLIRAADENDVLLAASVEPYARATVETASYAHARSVPIIAITDSRLSPLARLARQTILVSTEGPSFFHALTPAYFVGQILAALVAGHGGDAAPEIGSASCRDRGCQ